MEVDFGREVSLGCVQVNSVNTGLQGQYRFQRFQSDAWVDDGMSMLLPPPYPPSGPPPPHTPPSSPPLPSLPPGPPLAPPSPLNPPSAPPSPRPPQNPPPSPRPPQNPPSPPALPFYAPLPPLCPGNTLVDNTADLRSALLGTSDTIFLAPRLFSLSVVNEPLTFDDRSLKIDRNLSLIAPLGTAVLDGMNRLQDYSHTMETFKVKVGTTKVNRRVVHVLPGAHVYMENLNITGGWGDGGDWVFNSQSSWGAGVLNQGILTMTRCNVYNHTGEGAEGVGDPPSAHVPFRR